jgi:hypothetical protein
MKNHRTKAKPTKPTKPKPKPKPKRKRGEPLPKRMRDLLTF